MNPSTLLRTAAAQAVAAAAQLGSGGSPQDPDFAPLVNAQLALGQTWPSQSPAPGAAAMPNQLLMYGWDEESDSIAERSTAPQFQTVLTLVIEARVEVKAPAATAVLPQQPTSQAIAAAVDGALDNLCYAVRKAVLQGIGAAAMALNGGTPVVTWLKKVKVQNKFDGSGQRIVGNGVVAFEIEIGETFEPLITAALNEIDILIDATAGGLANAHNTGTGTISAVAVGLGAQAGAYAVAFTSATAFTVTAPDSTAAGSGTVGTAFNAGGVAFTITAGTTPFVAGDGFTVTVQVAAENRLFLNA